MGCASPVDQSVLIVANASLLDICNELEWTCCSENELQLI